MTEIPTGKFPIKPVSSAMIGFLGGVVAGTAGGMDVKTLTEILPNLTAMSALILALLYTLFIGNPERERQFREDMRQAREDHSRDMMAAWTYANQYRNAFEAGRMGQKDGEHHDQA